MYVPPRKKSRAGCIVSIVLAVILTPILLVGGGILFYLYQEYSEPVGDPPSNVALPAACDLVGKQTLQRLHTTNPDSTSYETPEYGESHCTWQQTLGKDGTNPRTLSVSVSTKTPADEDSAAESQADFDYMKENLATQDNDPYRVSPLDGLGDDAFVAVRSTGWSGAELLILKGHTVATISYHGSDKGLFSNGPIPEAESEQAARQVAEEIAAKL